MMASEGGVENIPILGAPHSWKPLCKIDMHFLKSMYPPSTLVHSLLDVSSCVFLHPERRGPCPVWNPGPQRPPSFFCGREEPPSGSPTPSSSSPSSLSSSSSSSSLPSSRPAGSARGALTGAHRLRPVRPIRWGRRQLPSFVLLVRGRAPGLDSPSTNLTSWRQKCCVYIALLTAVPAIQLRVRVVKKFAAVGCHHGQEPEG